MPDQAGEDGRDAKAMYYDQVRAQYYHLYSQGGSYSMSSPYAAGSGNSTSTSTSFSTPAASSGLPSSSTISNQEFSQFLTRQSGGGPSHFQSQKAFKQMSHYFNYEEFNDAKNLSRRIPDAANTRFTKKEIETLKKRKKDIKKKKLLDWLKRD